MFKKHPITVENYRGLTTEDEFVRGVLSKLSDIVDKCKKELSEILNQSDLEFCKILVFAGSELFHTAYTSAPVGIAEKFGDKEAGEKSWQILKIMQKCRWNMI